MRPNPSLLLLLIPLAAACGEKDGDDSAPDSAPPEVFAPAEGHWSVADEVVTSDPCGFFDGEGDTADTGGDQADGFTLTMNSEATFTIDQDAENGENFACALDTGDQSFTCAPEEMRNDMSGGGSREATLIYSQTVSGVFSSESSVDVGVDFLVTCEGADCGDIEAFLEVTLPCEARLDLSASADG
ncbi:MAG: hypothetical protein H6741_14335 [Alphaproteobacteria bacterium]|nr:hypothetical protein [Alphaproteobacteria bacterium]MCB9793894.1 hypothetical protein [Alphaproteobacteria bacterium]